MEDLDILLKEVDNIDKIYLYKEKNNWKAYEQSAFLLSQIGLVQSVGNEVWTEHEVIIATASVDFEKLRNSGFSLWMIKGDELAIITDCGYSVADGLLNDWKNGLKLNTKQ